MVVDAVFQEVVKPLGINICNTQWGKPLKNGLYEIRIRHLLPTLHLSNDANAKDVKSRELADTFNSGQGSLTMLCALAHNQV